MRVFAALVVVALGAASATAEVAVRVSGGHVDLTATAAPLADVLERLARQTGMKVVYEGPAPRQLVTLSLHGRTPTETVLSVFEGLGINFALVADPSGSRVQTLVVAGSVASSSPSSAAAGRAAPAPTARRSFGPPPGVNPEAVDPTLEEMEEEPAADEEAFAGLPPGADVTVPGGVPMVPPDSTLANPAAQAAYTTPGLGVDWTMETTPAPPGKTPGIGVLGSTNVSVTTPPEPAASELVMGRTCRMLPKSTVQFVSGPTNRLLRVIVRPAPE